MTSELVFERLSVGIPRERLAAAAGLEVDRLRRAEDGTEPLTEAQEQARKAALKRLIDEALARGAERQA
jgi:uncharacterized protein YbjQ (UPF0145 family)